MPRTDPGNNQQSGADNMIDAGISFDRRDMHKTWPLVKGCLMLAAGVVGFILLSMYVFKTFF